MFCDLRKPLKSVTSLAINPKQQGLAMVELVLQQGCMPLIKFEALGHGDDERIVRTLIGKRPVCEFREMLGKKAAQSKSCSCMASIC